MRTTISIDDMVVELGVTIAERDFRGNFSHLCEVALKDYCGPRAADGKSAELAAAAEEVGGVDNALAALRAIAAAEHAKRDARKRRKAA